MSQTKVKSGLLNFPDQTDFVKLPSGTTAQRPSSPEKGYSRYNTTDNKLEYWNGTEWQQLPALIPPTIVSVSYPGDDLAADPAGGQTITLRGANFLNGASVEIDGTTASVVTVVSGNEITFTAPAKAAGDYDILLTNGDSTTATFVDGMTYNGLPSWTTPAGNLGTFVAGSTIPTITLVATEPDSGVVSYSVTTGALPSGLTLTGADIDGTVPTPAGQTTYNFSVTASDDENQESTERAFNIVVYLQVTNTVNDHDPFDGNGVALYQLNGNATDVSGNYNGTASNVTYGTGVFGQAGVFNGNSSYINTPLNINNIVSNINDRTQDFSWSVWVNPLEITSDTIIYFGNSTVASPNYDAIYLNLANGNIRAGAYGGALYEMTTPTSANTWKHIVFLRDNSFLKLYVNGQFINQVQQLTDTSIAASINLEIGTAQNSQYLYGSIDQVRIFNTALTPLEVESLYREKIILCEGQADTLDILGDNSCIATYQLDGNANDLSGNYSGQDTYVSYGVGEFDLAGVFNGSSSWIDLPDNSFKLSTITVSAWFNSVSTQTNQTIYSCYDYQSAESRGFNIRVTDSNLILFQTYKSNANANVFSTSQIQRNTWNHVAIVATQSSASIYINGSLDNSGSITGFDYFTTHPFAIGRAASEAEHYFDGSIDQVRILNKALNSTEVTTLYNETACTNPNRACVDIFGNNTGQSLFQLNGDGEDFGYYYNGIPNNVTWTTGVYNDAGYFNNTNSGVYTDLDVLNDANEGVSIAFWFKSPTDVGQTVRLFQAGVENPNSEIGDFASVIIGNVTGTASGESISLFCRTESILLAFCYVSGDSDLYKDNQWHHVVINSTSNSKELYIDGSPKTITYLFGSNASHPLNVREIIIGGKNTLPSRTYIDQFRTFSKALSQSEVTTLYTNDASCG